MDPLLTSDTEKVIRLINYLIKLASIKSKIFRDVNEYEQALWLKDIPKLKGCFTKAWPSHEDAGDAWIEIQSYKRPIIPSPPKICLDWLDEQSLRNKKNTPSLESEIRIADEGIQDDQEELVLKTRYLKDYPDVTRSWNEYINEEWQQWKQSDDEWQRRHAVYTKLFTINQEQLKLGEEYELLLALGLLSWETPSNQRVRRHLIVANASLEFEAKLQRFTVRPLESGSDLRIELDMLDFEDQPKGAEDKAKLRLLEAGEDPWNRNNVDEALKTLVHSIDPEGEYNSSLEIPSTQLSSIPVVTYAPALILRKRSARGLTKTLESMKTRIEADGVIPAEFRDLAELEDENSLDKDDPPAEIKGDTDVEVFFPKPSNDEQRRILARLKTASGVVVQGPPGTGKSHTIANLVCHLLATGQRILITAKTPRALQVLKGHIPEELRPLCINLLGSGLEEKKSLESSIAEILNNNAYWNEEQEGRKRKKIEKELFELRKERAQMEEKLRSSCEWEVCKHNVAEGEYSGSAAQIARSVNERAADYQWFKDKASYNSSCPFSENGPFSQEILAKLLRELRRFGPEKRRELQLVLPDNLPIPEEIFAGFAQEKHSGEEAIKLSEVADIEIANQLVNRDATEIQIVIDKLLNTRAELQLHAPSPYAWVGNAVRDITNGNKASWQSRYDLTRTTIESIEPYINAADTTTIQLPSGVSLQTLLGDAIILAEHFKSGGKMGWWIFRPQIVKERLHVIDALKINGVSCTTFEQFSCLADCLRVRIGLDKLLRLWKDQTDKLQGPYALKSEGFKAINEKLRSILSLEDRIADCRKLFHDIAKAHKLLSCAAELQINVLSDSCKLALLCKEKAAHTNKFQILEASLTMLASNGISHPVTDNLRDAVRERNAEDYAHAWSKVDNLSESRKTLHEVENILSKLRAYAPVMTAELERDYNNPVWDSRIGHLKDAWQWMQAKTWIGEKLNQTDSASLNQRIKQIEEKINKLIAYLASSHAWSKCFSRLEDHHRRHMKAWSQSMKKLGKAKGKFASFHRREAQDHLDKCREAVPAWTMPLHRVWDTVPPRPSIFDVIIVDEASQCGFEALPLLYLGKKILIVGDDKQISPEAVGIALEPVHQLMKKYLSDFSFKSTFDLQTSLFDHGDRIHPKNPITLREHFRCMPEIIRFSNDQWYFGSLIPLRQYGPDRLPPLINIHVPEGFRQGANSKVINDPEADAIVAKIVELQEDERYRDKTMGVIVLQGNAQAGLIEGKLLNELGSEEIHRRKIICGHPYSFQGDQRDIIFLSMVAAPNEHIGVLSKSEDERRFNVAASRARDQMFLFHSVTTEDLSDKCLRQKLLKFFLNTEPVKIADIDKLELEHRAIHDRRDIIKPPSPFDSWFEVDVALAIAGKGYHVIPQFNVAGKRIDLVVEGGNARLAVECDGDTWHGPDQYDADMLRQRQLERCGWAFFRIRGSSFYANQERALEKLWVALEERGIFPFKN